MKFSKRIVISYTLIILIPLFIIVLGIESSLVRKQRNKLISETKLILDGYANYISDIVASYDKIESIISTDPMLSIFLYRPDGVDEDERISTILSKTSYIEQVLSLSPYLYAIRIFTDSPSIPERWPVFFNENRIQNEEVARWVYDYEANYLGNKDTERLPALVSTRPMYKGTKKLGLIQIAVKMTEIFPFLSVDSDEVFFAVAKKNENTQDLDFIKYSQNYDKLKLSLREFEKIKSVIYNSNGEGTFKKYSHFSKIVEWRFIEDLDVFIIQLNNSKSVYKDFISLAIAFFLVFIFVSFLLIIIIRYTTENLLSGIYSVMDGMSEVKKGNFLVQIDVKGHDEVSETQQIFNSMTSQLASQIEQIKNEQSLIADTEMKAMQNQINAHFLYNVLETIRMQAVLADQDDIAESLQVLGRMMRYCLRWRIHRVSLEQEIEYITSYIYILNIRNDYTISLQIEIPEEYMGIEIPKMILQPLVENAFVHAIEKEEKDANLRVFAEISESKDRIILGVQDFGCGMTFEQVDKLNEYLLDDKFERSSTGSIGLKNIQQRLNMFYGSDYRIQITSYLGEGTTITVPIPLKLEGKNDNNSISR